MLFHALALASAAADADAAPDTADAATAAAVAAGRRAAGLMRLYRAVLSAEIFAKGGVSPAVPGEIAGQEGLVVRSGPPAPRLIALSHPCRNITTQVKIFHGLLQARRSRLISVSLFSHQRMLAMRSECRGVRKSAADSALWCERVH